MKNWQKNIFKETEMDELVTIRERINDVDQKMALLFEERMKLVGSVAEYKMKGGIPVFDEKREQEVIRRNENFVEDESIRSYYVNFLKDTMAVSKRYQHKILEGMRVAYSGVTGAFAQIAVDKIFPDAAPVSCKDFKEAYEMTEKGLTDCTVLPLENSNAGEVGAVIDLIFSGSLFVNEVYSLSIHQCLVALPESEISDIKTVISHPQALSQCEPYLRKLGAKKKECVNTAVAAQTVLKGNDKTVAAIASRDTAKLYGLKILKENINESETNTTRFAVLSRVMNKEKSDGSIIVFTVPDEAGSLAHAINIIGNHGFNMRSIKSRAMKDLMWKYYFYVEIDGDLKSRSGSFMLAELSDCCDKLRFIGSFNNAKVVK